MRKKILKGILAVIVLLFLAIAASLIYVQVNKEKILADAINKLRERVNGELIVGKQEISLFRNFPFPSVHLKDVALRDVNFSQHGHTFLEAKEVYLSLNVLKALKGVSPVRAIIVENASVYIFNDEAGRSNTALFKGGKGGALPGSIELINTRIIQDDRRKPKRHQVFAKQLQVKPENTSSGYSLETELDLQVDSLSFNLAKGGYLKGHSVKGKLDLLLNGGAVSFRDEKLRINNEVYHLSGEFNLIQKKFSLQINTPVVEFKKVRALLTPKAKTALSMFEIRELKNVVANISGPTTPGQPDVLISAEVRDESMTTPFMDFNAANFKVLFNNRVDTSLAPHDSNSVIKISDFNAKWRTIPVQSNGMLIRDLTNPMLNCDLSSRFGLQALDKILSSRTLALKKGEARVDLKYDGPMKRDETTNAFINGTVSVSNGELTYRPRSIDLARVNALLRFRNSDLLIEKLDAAALGQQFYMKGEGRKLLTLIQTTPSDAMLDWEIRTPDLDISRIRWLLKKPGAQPGNGQKNINGMATRIDDVIEKGRLNVKLISPRVRYNQFNAAGLLADVSLLSDRYVLNRVRMNHAGGIFEMKGSVTAAGNGHDVKVYSEMKGVDVSEVFKAFNNFGQNGILSQNIEGELDTDVSAVFKINEEGNVLPYTMTGIIDFSLLNGALLNFEPVKKLQKFIFKKRDFDNIRFAELKNKLEVKNGEIKINRMEISSSVLWMYVEGIYSSRGNTDISIQVPLKNLRKRDELNPENAGLKNGGTSIYVRGRPGDDGNIRFKLDLFNRFEKEKNQK